MSRLQLVDDFGMATTDFRRTAGCFGRNRWVARSEAASEQQLITAKQAHVRRFARKFTDAVIRIEVSGVMTVCVFEMQRRAGPD
jgi:hypothetical protein